MNDAPQSKSKPLPGESDTRIPPVATPYIAYCVCNGRAYLDNSWRPQNGLSQNLRLFTCLAGHDTYQALTWAKLEHLTKEPT